LPRRRSLGFEGLMAAVGDVITCEEAIESKFIKLKRTLIPDYPGLHKCRYN
jgi:hypothetical protein